MNFRHLLLRSISLLIIIGTLSGPQVVSADTDPSELQFVRQGAKRLIFDDSQAISLATLNPADIVGIDSMHPARSYAGNPQLEVTDGVLSMASEAGAETRIWFGGFNPFATYSLDLHSGNGAGSVGFEFSNPDGTGRFIISLRTNDDVIEDLTLRIVQGTEEVLHRSIMTNEPAHGLAGSRLIIQMLGSGLNAFLRAGSQPQIIGQAEFSDVLDVRQKTIIQGFQSNLYVKLNGGSYSIKRASSDLTTGVGQADIRAITYKDGRPFLDQGRLWYTISIRGRDLPHHVQGVFSLDPSVFDIRLEGVIAFDQGDGLLRNEISSHIFYDEENDIWRGLTTGFTAYASKDEKKQILAIESKKDPRFGFSIMKSWPTGIVGGTEDSHILFDEDAQKWRLLTCENRDGFKAVIMESDHWDRGYRRIAGPVKADSTGTSLQKIGDTMYAFSGSKDRKVYVYSYPELETVGTLQMDLPPWDPESRTRIWPNVVMLPEGYPARYVALMMDRYNYPGMEGKHWSYGALYLYHGFEPGQL